jgi:hypothetical protein
MHYRLVYEFRNLRLVDLENRVTANRKKVVQLITDNILELKASGNHVPVDWSRVEGLPEEVKSSALDNFRSISVSRNQNPHRVELHEKEAQC